MSITLPSPIKQKQDWFSKPQPGHLVQFYSHSDTLSSSLLEYIKTGLADGHECIVIATRAHLLTLDEQLKIDGIDVLATQARKQYLTFDAADTLAQFMVDGLPNWDRFLTVVGSMIEKTAQKRQPIRAYGEMVALLWRKGNKEAVIMLENFWNTLLEMYSFSLYCAYPKLHFIMHREDLNEISDCHNLHVSAG